MTAHHLNRFDFLRSQCLNLKDRYVVLDKILKIIFMIVIFIYNINEVISQPRSVTLI